ncbi:GntR family transcriptional regulator [Saccharibacillus alkalitolerans]|uniref:GntR family transcriptional regulator n=1 Tax=Saccharibacillus alkalitolerans TaxID=2705290 RepID=A0ABX0FBH3_9BACL|nr:GntR family transcriptional regulator [Saccharibacillus alkalitolerans]NGZ77725.1 GntR family transcriptional regulator [Saccharibacillus alkalitolerans]
MNILISNSSGEPIYAQIVSQIRQLILNGELEPGTPLPSIRQLAKDLQISVITTKRAYEELERERLIDSMVGRGSFVSGVNREFLRERRLKALEEKLAEAAAESRMLGLDKRELFELLETVYEEDEQA